MIAALQRLLRWLFMHAEALFNRAFGDRLNPLYHLGAISFFLFWIVCGTGLVLFVFFNTSVTGAYRSVEMVTKAPWFAGSVLRSVHRYASDAMVVTMVIHMLRYFAFDRLRGFRWFSWVTGVVLIWLIYVAGVNGYMLPWDQLAQFVITASFEWLDWLPSFGGTLMRNFIYPASVSDRFFSLLVFIHIGVPLLTLLLMWVHVQRVPKASTQPPRPIALSVSLTLIALSLLLPVASQGGPARLNVSPTTLQLDWFLLPLLPLIDAWPLGRVWALMGGATALLLALPWLRWRRGGAKAPALHLTVHPGAVSVPVRSGETLLEAGLRADLPLRYDCRAGGCGLCLCTVLNGRVEHGAYQPAVLTEAMRARGQALMCCAVPLEDLEIEVESLAPTGAGAVRQRVGRVVRIEPLAADVKRILLALPEGERLDFAAGQYLNVVLDDGQRRAFSFANPPHDNNFIELHVRLIPGGRFTTFVFNQLKVGDTLRLEGPLGRFTLHESERPILFVAGATGFAPIKSIVEDAFQRGVHRPMRLYWGVRHRDDLYLLDLAERWQREHDNFQVVPVLSDSAPGDGWTGRRGLVHEAMLEDFPDLSGHEVYACGSVKMVEAAVPAFLAQGLGEAFCFSDAFTPSGAASAAPAVPRQGV
jgi:NAD(P)H-flavin reductase/quinol-cytochrome oxidoreductase complex cytochrome b subunit/ferredoxin